MKPMTNIVVFILAVVFFAVCITGATLLLLTKYVGEASFVVLVLISLTAACLIGFYGNIDFIKVSDFEIKFRQVKESEEKIKKLGASIVTLVEQLEKSAYVDHTFDQAEFAKAKDEVKKNST
jgi:hypothetical protein